MRPLRIFVITLCGVLNATRAHAIINQVDGQILPLTTTLQECLDKSSVASSSNPAPGEGRGVLNAVANAAIAPQTFRPAVRSDGRRVAQFTMVGEGAGYQNRFGWYNVGDSPFTPTNRQEIFGCREAEASCDCPCPLGPRRVMPPAAVCTSWLNPNIVEVDFDCIQRMGRWRGGPIAFYILTPELVESGSSVNCPPANSLNNRVYSTDNTVNDDGDYVHYLVYTSRTFPNGFYFGWEDLFRGGDNEFADVLVRAIGLVPTCLPSAEVCDGRDNNCNSQIDENLGVTTCGMGACVRTTPSCVAGRPQTCTPGTPATEVCNNQDDNCNGLIDEGVSRMCTAACGPGTQYCTAGAWGDCVGTRSPVPEVCDNLDNDCNGVVDDGLARTCRTDCGLGVELCSMGVYAGCTAQPSAPETCNGRDDDCDGMVDDGIAPQPCRSACGTGTERCVNGTLACDAPRPRVEVCNNRDDDCNGQVDDVPPGGPCGASGAGCNPGRWTCEAGTFVCSGIRGGNPETCNGLDDDCDGLVDEGDPGGGDACDRSPAGVRLCSLGTLHCRAGTLRCEGGVLERPETCNCNDDDCNGRVDDPPLGGSLCSAGARCVGCECRSPCRMTEPRCATGQECGADGFCGPPAKFYRCGDGGLCHEGQTCRGDRCVDLCDGVQCSDGMACVSGRCVEDSCYERGCAAGQICVSAVCVNNPCRRMACAPNQYCRPEPDGTARCVGSCADVRCADGRRCEEGACVADPCAGVRCPAGQVCREEGGTTVCGADPCATVTCGRGRRCAAGRCVDNPCSYVTCPGGSDVVCRAGQCVRGSPLPTREELNRPPDGCACRAGVEAARSGGGAFWLLGLVSILGISRRRVARGAR